jgi:transketolase
MSMLSKRQSGRHHLGASLQGLGFAGTCMLALPVAFLDAGELPTLHDRYGISAEKMNSRIKAWLV